MGKVKLDQSAGDADTSVVEEHSYEERLKFVNKISQPMASRKLTKRIYKCLKKARKSQRVPRGLKEIVQAIKKKDLGGLAIFAGDIQPIEVMCHLPILCEENEIPYCYVPSKLDLGRASGGQNGTCLVYLRPNEAYQESFTECYNEVKKLSYLKDD